MGGSLPTREQDIEEGYQDDVFPWFHLIQWSAEDAKNNRIFRYDLAGAQQKALALSRDVDSFMRMCPTSLPKAGLGNLSASVTPPQEAGFSMDDETNFAEWAGALLEWNPELRQGMLPRLVPRRLSETTFWSRYFAALRSEIQELMFSEDHWLVVGKGALVPSAGRLLRAQ
eukprot:Skav201599  [mRNA]  locus=scaffold152:765980:768765:+ [translate_table: standard]